MGRQERLAIIREIEAKRGSRVICYLTTDRPNIAAQMMKDVLPIFINHLRRDGKHKKIDVFLFTHGGDIITGFGLARLLREYAEEVAVLVPDCCHSAGTLFALGANEIFMTRGATLSPIDPSITRPLNPAVQLNPQQPPQVVPLSVESVAGYQALVTKEWKADKNPLLKILAEKVHPLALGDVYRTRQQIEMLARRLLLQHRKDKGNIGRIINTLSKSLGSHDYLIYLSEAKSLLGDQVRSGVEMENLVWALYSDYAAEMQLGVEYNPGILLARARAGQVAGAAVPVSVPSVIEVALIESISAVDIAIRRSEITEMIIPLPNGTVHRQPVENVTFAGWERQP